MTNRDNLSALLLLGSGICLFALWIPFSPQHSPFFIRDAWENMLYGLYIAHGKEAYQDFGSNHLPGVYLWIGWLARLFRQQHALPSTEAFLNMHRIAFLAMGLFQSLSLFVAFRQLRYSTWLSTAGSLLLVGIGFRFFNTQLPLTETLLPFLFVLAPILILNPSPAVLPFLFFGLFFGLTTALPILFLGIYFAFHFRKIFSVAISITLLGVALCSLFFIDLSQIYFFSVELNRHFWNPSQLFTGLREHFSAAALTQNPLALVPTTLLLSCFVRTHHRLRFMALCFLCSWLMLWRNSFGEKTYAIIGINIGLILLFISQHRVISNAIARPLKRVEATLFLLFIGSLFLFSKSLLPTPAHPTRAAAFDEANLCHLGETGNCRCLLIGAFYHEIFMQQDIEPCQGQSLWMWLQSANTKTLLDLQQKVANPKVAFLLFGDEENEHYAFPMAMYQKITQGGDHHCLNVESQFTGPFKAKWLCFR